MKRVELLAGKVVRWVLPVVNPGPPSEQPDLKRLNLPQGELSQFYDQEEGIRYIASIELKAGSTRGNHYHHIKKEYVYLISGEVRLVVEEVETKKRESMNLAAGDLVLIQTGIAHALEVTKTGLAVEFSPNRFDAADIIRMKLV